MTGTDAAAGAKPYVKGAAVYLALLRVPQAARLLTAAVLGRAQLGMAPLAILLVVHDRTGSFADAGIAVGVFGGIGAAATPLLGRAVDRVGQVPVLVSCGTIQSMAFMLLGLGARHGASFGAIVVACALAGVALPPLASCMRALWPVLVPDLNLRESAFTLDAISQELVWTLGPLLVAALVAVASASVALYACAALTAFGVGLYVTSSVPRNLRRPGRPTSSTGALASNRLRALLACIAILSLGTGICQVAIPAIAVRAGSQAASGVLLGAWSVGSIVGGIAFGSIHWASSIVHRYCALCLLVAAATVPLIWSHSILAGAISSLVAGLPLAALIACQYTLVAEMAPGGTITEAFAWNSAAAFGAVAAGAAIGGWLVKQHGLGLAFGVAVATELIAFTTALVTVARKTMKERE
jgi:MFS family permease